MLPRPALNLAVLLLQRNWDFNMGQVLGVRRELSAWVLELLGKQLCRSHSGPCGQKLHGRHKGARKDNDFRYIGCFLHTQGRKDKLLLSLFPPFSIASLPPGGNQGLGLVSDQRDLSCSPLKPGGNGSEWQNLPGLNLGCTTYQPCKLKKLPYLSES